MGHHDFGIHEIAPHAGEMRLAVTGDLDIMTAPALRKRLQELHDRGRGVVLDLSNVPFIDSTGVHVLVDSMRQAKRAGWRFRIQSDVSPPVRAVLKMLNLDHGLIDGP